MATIEAIADWIVLMCEGKIVEQGGKQDVLSPPHHDYNEPLLSFVPLMDPG